MKTPTNTSESKNLSARQVFGTMHHAKLELGARASPPAPRLRRAGNLAALAKNL